MIATIVPSRTTCRMRGRSAKFSDCRPFLGKTLYVGDFLDLLGKLTGQPRSVIDELDVADLPAIFAAMEDCLSV